MKRVPSLQLIAPEQHFLGLVKQDKKRVFQNVIRNKSFLELPEPDLHLNNHFQNSAAFFDVDGQNTLTARRSTQRHSTNKDYTPSHLSLANLNIQMQTSEHQIAEGQIPQGTNNLKFGDSTKHHYGAYSPIQKFNDNSEIPKRQHTLQSAMTTPTQVAKSPSYWKRPKIGQKQTMQHTNDENSTLIIENQHEILLQEKPKFFLNEENKTNQQEFKMTRPRSNSASASPSIQNQGQKPDQTITNTFSTPDMGFRMNFDLFKINELQKAKIQNETQGVKSPEKQSFSNAVEKFQVKDFNSFQTNHKINKNENKGDGKYVDYEQGQIGSGGQITQINKQSRFKLTNQQTSQQINQIMDQNEGNQLKKATAIGAESLKQNQKELSENQKERKSQHELIKRLIAYQHKISDQSYEKSSLYSDSTSEEDTIVKSARRQLFPSYKKTSSKQKYHQNSQDSFENHRYHQKQSKQNQLQCRFCSICRRIARQKYSCCERCCDCIFRKEESDSVDDYSSSISLKSLIKQQK